MNLPSTGDGRYTNGLRLNSQSAANVAQPSFIAQALLSGEQKSGGNTAFALYFGIFRKYWQLVAKCCVAALALSVLVTLLMPRIYTATSSIQIDREAAKVVRSQDMTAENSSDPQFYSTQYELLKSRALAERIASSLSLADRKEFAGSDGSFLSRLASRLLSRSDGEENEVEGRQRLAADRVMKNLTVQPVVMSRIVKVSYSDRDPRVAQEISTAVAENFVGMTLDRRFSASSYARGFLEEKLQQVKSRLEESETQVVAYARREGIVNVDDKLSVSGANLRSLSDALSASTADRIRNEQLWIQAQADNGLGLPQVMADKMIGTAREKRTQLGAEYQDKLRIMKPDFPELKQILAQITEYDRQIARQIELVKRAVRSQFEASRDQEISFAKKLDSLKEEVLDLRGRSIQYNILQREVDTNRSLYDGLLQQYKEVGVTGAVAANNVSIIDKAELPRSPSSPSYILNLTVALFGGLLAAAGTIAMREIVDDTFKSPDEIEAMLGLTVLGVIPMKEKIEGEVSEGENVARATLANPSSALAEAYRSLRTALQFSTTQGIPKILLVTSSQPGEGKSTSSLCMAANFAQIGNRVLLIDGDLRKASLHKALGLSNSAGLSNVLTGTFDSNSVIQDTAYNNLTFMSSGPLPPNPAELLAGPQMSSMLSMASDSFDLIIIDGPPVMGLADAPLLSSLVDGTLLVVDVSHTRRRVVGTAVRRLQLARAQIVGALVTKFDYHKANNSYGYGYGYGYGGLEYFNYGKPPADGKPALPIELSDGKASRPA